jgi:hypothetical protein
LDPGGETVIQRNDCAFDGRASERNEDAVTDGDDWRERAGNKVGKRFGDMPGDDHVGVKRPELVLQAMVL